MSSVSKVAFTNLLISPRVEGAPAASLSLRILPLKSPPAPPAILLS